MTHSTDHPAPMSSPVYPPGRGACVRSPLRRFSLRWLTTLIMLANVAYAGLITVQSLAGVYRHATWTPAGTSRGRDHRALRPALWRRDLPRMVRRGISGSVELRQRIPARVLGGVDPSERQGQRHDGTTSTHAEDNSTRRETR
jgi:hypothetical protein